MHSTQIVKKPLITEKSTYESQKHNRFSFEVHPDASKDMIRTAVQEIYKVRVVGVLTQTRRTATRRTRWGMVAPKYWKRAVVQIHPEDRIELY